MVRAGRDGAVPDLSRGSHLAAGPPAFDRITLHLQPDFAPGEAFTIERSGHGDRITVATLNGVPLGRTWLHHEEIVAGGALVLETP